MIQRLAGQERRRDEGIFAGLDQASLTVTVRRALSPMTGPADAIDAGAFRESRVTARPAADLFGPSSRDVVVEGDYSARDAAPSERDDRRRAVKERAIISEHRPPDARGSRCSRPSRVGAADDDVSS